MIIEKKETKPVAMNAFELISLSQGLNLSSLFETKEVFCATLIQPCSHGLPYY